MIQAILAPVGAYLLAFATWMLYLAAMAIIPKKSRLSPVAKAHAYVLVSVAIVMDAVLNIIVASVLFLDPPRDLLLTGRLKRYIRDPQEFPWRRALALWVCEHLLDPFDPDGNHCG